MSDNDKNIGNLKSSSQPKKVHESKYNSRQNQKESKSSEFFKGTKISTCSYIKMKGGKPVAVPYYEKPQQTYAEAMSKSTYTKSLSHDTYKIGANLHVGSLKKPLEPYNPDCYRNKLPIPDPTFPKGNFSTVVIGDPYLKDPKHFISVSRNSYGNFGLTDPISNPGILAEKTKYHHNSQAK